LNNLFEEVLEKPALNTKPILLEKAKALIAWAAKFEFGATYSWLRWPSLNWLS
jgi:hypothetical protein